MTPSLLLLLASSFEAYLEAPFPPADGFDLPTHEERSTHASAHGRVIRADAGGVSIEHLYYENHEKKHARSEYSDLSRIEVKEGDVVRRGQKIGAWGDGLRFELKNELSLSAREFVEARRTLPVPQSEAALLLVDQQARRLALYARGELVEEVEVGFGQRPGQKRRQGDLKTPKGMYFVVHKYRGKFSGPYGRYYGGHWIKVNYPNRFDAEWGVEQKLIDPSAADSIAAAWSKRELTDQRTPLGGGIGFHGWAGDWSWNDTGWLSWGCVVFHNEDIRRLFDRIPLGAMVVLR